MTRLLKHIIENPEYFKAFILSSVWKRNTPIVNCINGELEYLGNTWKERKTLQGASNGGFNQQATIY